VKKILVLPLFVGLLLSGCSNSDSASVNKEVVKKEQPIVYKKIDMSKSRVEMLRYFPVNVLNEYQVEKPFGTVYKGNHGGTDDIMFMFSQRMTITKEDTKDVNFGDYVKNIYSGRNCEKNQMIDVKKGNFPKNTIYIVTCTRKVVDVNNPSLAQIMIEKNDKLYYADVASRLKEVDSTLISEAIDMLNTIQN
jgi:hypothetical protein